MTAISRDGIAERFRKRADAFATLIRNTPPHAWTNPSPCDGWLARDVVAHVVGFFGHVLREKAGVASLPWATASADDPATAFHGIREAVQQVLDDPATTDELTKYLDAALSFDLPQHWWDLAKATGQDAAMDPEEVELLWAALSPQSPDWWKWQVDNGHYAPAVPVPDDAPLQDRVLGLIGRDPNWTLPR